MGVGAQGRGGGQIKGEYSSQQKKNQLTFEETSRNQTSSFIPCVLLLTNHPGLVFCFTSNQKAAFLRGPLAKRDELL